MSITIHCLTVVLKKEAIEAGYPGGLEASSPVYNRSVQTNTSIGMYSPALCASGRLTR